MPALFVLYLVAASCMCDIASGSIGNTLASNNSSQLALVCWQLRNLTFQVGFFTQCGA